jgi:aminoglycoside 2''-phosphotransferase
LGEQDQLDTAEVAEVIRQQFPEVSPVSVSYLGEGCDSSAFDVNSEWVFRFPKRADVEQQLLLEFRVLPVLAAHSPLPLPNFCFLGQPSVAFPRHFGGYPKLPGVPGNRVDPRAVPFDRWAPMLARFLSWLHAFSVHDAIELGVKYEQVAALIEEVQADALGDFEQVGQVAPDAPLESWHTYLTSGPPMSAPVLSTTVVVHRDLAAEHVLCDPTTMAITGIIDWSEIAISDALVDFAGLFHWGGTPFIRAVLSSYDGPLDAAALPLAQFLAACRGVGDVVFGLETARREYVEAGIRALSLCVSP